MTLRAISSAQVDRAIGQQWRIVVEADELPVLAVTKPDGTALTPAILFEVSSDYYVGVYVADIVPATAGRYIATVTTAGTGESLVFQAWAQAITTNALLPNVADLDTYLGGSGTHSYSDPELQDALNAESAAQRGVCRIPAVYPDDLRQALLRRASRNLYMRRQLAEMPNESADFPVPAQTPPGRDPEVRRFEARFRKIVFG